MNYPQLLIPENILNVIETDAFPEPIEPTIPKEPINESNIGLKLIILGIGSLLMYFDHTFTGFLIFLASIYWLIKSPEKQNYAKAIKKYKAEVIKHEKEYATYCYELKIFKKSPQLYHDYKRNLTLRSFLKLSTSHSKQNDYKKGASHNFFKIFLNQTFGEKILEDGSIKKVYYSRNYYYDDCNDYDPYIVDFLYFDYKTNLHIAIEIDEPYTLTSKKIIHTNDYKRNKFFLDNNWIVLRFAEEQIVRNPYLCCNYLENIVDILNNNSKDILSLKSNVPIVQKWTNESVHELIKNNYRNQYLSLLQDKKYLEYLEILESMFGGMFGAKLENDKPDYIL